MKTIFSPDHALQSVATELFRGRQIEAIGVNAVNVLLGFENRPAALP